MSGQNSAGHPALQDSQLPKLTTPGVKGSVHSITKKVSRRGKNDLRQDFSLKSLNSPAASPGALSGKPRTSTYAVSCVKPSPQRSCSATKKDAKAGNGNKLNSGAYFIAYFCLVCPDPINQQTASGATVESLVGAAIEERWSILQLKMDRILNCISKLLFE